MSSFMVPEIWPSEFYEIDGPMGTESVDVRDSGEIDLDHWTANADANDDNSLPEGLEDYCENTFAHTIERHKGWAAHLTAPGYMDQTEICVFDTEAEAIEHLLSFYYDQEDDSELPEVQDLEERLHALTH